MKNLLACLAVFAAFGVSAQQFSPPWNPDADDNGSIGAADVLATLSVYGNEWGVNTSLTCDYVPSNSEQWFLDVLTGEVIIDSLNQVIISQRTYTFSIVRWMKLMNI